MMFVNRDNSISFIKLWLTLMFLLIVIMVFVGGLTRLTDSGLSITEWELLSGILPPISSNDWNYYFSEYKKIPEYKLMNSNISLNEFKIIFYWEYFHRLLGRVVGLFSILPLIYLSIKSKESSLSIKKYYLIFLLVCLQGFVGWFMVQSGLVENVDVSHFRLSLHLSLALLLICLIVWFIFEIYKVNKFKQKISQSLLISIFFLIFVQIILGSFLAGLNGGLIYNTWPDMNGTFLPNDVDKSDFLSSQLINNPSIIQFFHRLTAYILLLFLLILNYKIFSKKLCTRYLMIFNFAILLQIFLGILALLSGVEIQYASLHQLGSIFVLSSFLLILYKNT